MIYITAALPKLLSDGLFLIKVGTAIFHSHSEQLKKETQTDLLWFSQPKKQVHPNNASKMPPEWNRRNSAPCCKGQGLMLFL